MEIKSTQKSLCYAGGVLLFFILLSHLTLSRPEGSVFSSLGILFVSVFQLAFLIIGLVVGIAVCLVAMLFIFVAAAYLVNGRLGRETGKRTKEAALAQVRWMLAAVAPGKFGPLQPAAACVGNDAVPMQHEPLDAQPEVARSVREATEPVQSAVHVQLAEDVHKIENRLALIESSIQSIEQNSAQFAHTEQLEAMKVAVQSADERFREALDARIVPMQDRLQEMSMQNEAADAADKKFAEIVLRIDTLEKKTAELAALPQQIEALKQKPAAKGKPRKKSPGQ